MSKEEKKAPPTWLIIVFFLLIAIGLITCLTPSSKNDQDSASETVPDQQKISQLKKRLADNRDSILASIKESIADEKFGAAIYKAQPFESLEDPEINELLAQARVEVEKKQAIERELERLAPFDWRHSDSFNEFDSVTTKFATARSLNSANFEFPYQGTNHLTITFRKTGKKLEAMLSIDKGQFSCGYNGCTVGLKIGDAKPMTFSATAAANGVSDTIFIDNPTRLLNTLKNPTKLMIQADFYRYSNTVFNFETSTKLEI